MPYTLQTAPEAIKALPKHAKEIYIAAYNNAYKEYNDEARSAATAWQAVKTKYHKNSKDEWVINMSEFAGFEDWIPIFRGGIQVDSAGLEHDGDDLIAKALANFDTSKHEPPLTVGHPVDNHPSYGWVSELKADETPSGKVLLAKFKQVVPEFAAAVANGMYKKRSASFYPDGRLRHVGFLGAMPPAVKGLADLKFNAEEECLLFEENTGADYGTASTIIIESIQTGVTNMAEEIKEVVDPSIAEDLQAKVKELEKQLLDQKVSFEEKVKAMEFTNRQKEIQSFINDLQKAGRITPAHVDSGLQNFMESLLNIPTFNFGEKEVGCLEWFKNFLSGSEPVIDLNEFDSANIRTNKGTDDLDTLDKLTMNYMEKHNLPREKYGETLSFIANQQKEKK